MKKWFLFLFVFFACLLGALFWQFYPRNQCLLPISLFPDSLHAFTTVEVEGKKVLLRLDLGCGFPLSFNREVLNNIKQKKYLREVSWKDHKKRDYAAKDYLLPKIKLGRATITDICAREENEDFVRNATVKSFEGERTFKDEGRVGLGLFLETQVEALFLDLKNGRAFFIKDIHRFREKGYCLEEMIKLPLLCEKAHLFLQVGTDVGEKKFMLDTGYSMNVLHPSLGRGNEEIDPFITLPLFTSSKFMLGNRDFGEEDFYLFDFDYIIDGMKGVLGMPFFKKFALILDFQNNVAYIALSQTKK
jgi:hypothetical protein